MIVETPAQRIGGFADVLGDNRHASGTPHRATGLTLIFRLTGSLTESPSAYTCEFPM